MDYLIFASVIVFMSFTCQARGNNIHFCAFISSEVTLGTDAVLLVENRAGSKNKAQKIGTTNKVPVKLAAFQENLKTRIVAISRMKTFAHSVISETFSGFWIGAKF